MNINMFKKGEILGCFVFFIYLCKQKELILSMLESLKNISVVAAIIVDGDKILAAQRGYGEWKGWWEFPGGKIEPGEGPIEALRREIREELAMDINVGEKLCIVEYDYPTFHLSMQCFLCTIKSGLTLVEHGDARWLGHEEMYAVKWLPADEKVIEKIKLIYGA